MRLLAYQNLSKEWLDLLTACGGYKGVAERIGVSSGGMVRTWAIQKSHPLLARENDIKDLCLELGLPFPHFIPPIKIRRKGLPHG